MNKYLLFAIAALIAMGAWSARPGASAAVLDAPLLVDGPPAEIAGKILDLPLQNAFQRAPIAGGFDDFASQLTLKRDVSDARREVVSLWHGNEKLLVIDISIKPSGAQSAIELSTQIPASALTMQQVLRRGDGAVLAAAADLALTDYISAMLESRPLRRSEELRQALDQMVGFDDSDHLAFARRTTRAIAQAFGSARTAPSDAPAGDNDEDLSAWYEEDAPSDGESLDGGDEPRPDAAHGEDPVPDQPATPTADE